MFALNRVIFCVEGELIERPAAGHPPMALPAADVVTHWKFWRADVAVLVSGQQREKTPPNGPINQGPFNHPPL
jgi:hypothetical protein